MLFLEPHNISGRHVLVIYIVKLFKLAIFVAGAKIVPTRKWNHQLSPIIYFVRRMQPYIEPYIVLNYRLCMETQNPKRSKQLSSQNRELPSQVAIASSRVILPLQFNLKLPSHQLPI